MVLLVGVTHGGPEQPVGGSPEKVAGGAVRPAEEKPASPARSGAVATVPGEAEDPAAPRDEATPVPPGGDAGVRPPSERPPEGRPPWRGAMSGPEDGPNAWLGLSLLKPDPTVAAQIPGLPGGVGFVVESVLSGGPAEAARMRAMDVVWKMGDQMLVNKAQLATLLNLKRPGDQVVLAVFRAGQPMEVALTLGEAPEARDPMARPVFPENPPFEEKIVIPGERTAVYSTEQGKAVVKKEGGTHRVTITGPDKKVLFDDLLPEDGSLEAVPKGWHRRVWVLRRSLDHAMENQIVPVRPPRSRVIPPSDPAPKPPANGSDH